jgi:hypothetical protein
LTEESQIPPLDPEMVMLFVEGKLDDPNFDLKTRQYKEGYVPPKVVWEDFYPMETAPFCSP